MPTLYGRKTSINVQKAAWALGEAGLDFDWAGKDDRPGQITIPDYAAINPQLRVPALRDDGVILRQSNAIVRYVSRNYAFGTLFPEDTGTAVWRITGWIGRRRTTGETWSRCFGICFGFPRTSATMPRLPRAWPVSPRMSNTSISSLRIAGCRREPVHHG